MNTDRTGEPVVDERSRTDVAERTTSTGISRRQVVRTSSLVGVGSLLGVAGVERTAAAEVDDTPGENGTRPDEVVHLDYGEYESWEDIYRVSNGDRNTLEFVSSPSCAGDTALQLRIRDGDHWGVSTHYDFDDGLLELNSRVQFALDDDWTMGDGSESHCGLWNCALSLGAGSAGGGVPDGTNGWSNRLYVSTRDTDSDGPFHLLSYTKHMDERQDHDFVLQDEPYAVGHPEIEPDRWYEFEYYVRVNTVDDGVANPDGAVQYWLDGDLVYDRQDLRFSEDRENNIIETNGPAGYYGSGCVAPQNLYTYYANHSMALDGTFDGAEQSDDDDATDDEDATDPEDLDLAAVEQYVHEAVNERRGTYGVHELTFDTELRDIARAHSEDMAARDYLAHDSPDGNGLTDRYEQAGYECSVNGYAGGENVAQTWYDTPVDTDARGTVRYENERELGYGVVAQWMNSAGHASNIVAPHWENHGIGVAMTAENQVYVTQNFC